MVLWKAAQNLPDIRIKNRCGVSFARLEQRGICGTLFSSEREKYGRIGEED